MYRHISDMKPCTPKLQTQTPIRVGLSRRGLVGLSWCGGARVVVPYRGTSLTKKHPPRRTLLGYLAQKKYPPRRTLQ